MSPWNANRKVLTNKGSIRTTKKRDAYKAAGHCISGCVDEMMRFLPLAPTSTVFCVACLAKHSERVRSYNLRKKEKAK